MSSGDAGDWGVDQPDGSAAGWEQFAPLYEEHHLRLYRFALLLCNGRQAVAEDAVAETFVHVFEAWQTGRVQKVFADARQSLMNVVLGQHRPESVAHRYMLVRRGDDRGRREAFDETVERSSLFGYLERLSDRQRAAVVMRFYGDMSYEQIASPSMSRSGPPSPTSRSACNGSAN